MLEPRTWDIFCRVVDNLGDAGVCWRLARQLAAEHGAAVRLWIDDLRGLRLLHPAVREVECQTIESVEVRRWPAVFAQERPAQVVIEAFGCGLPDEYVAGMASAAPASLWIVLEYLSAEPWVPGHHGLPSPHPRWPLARYYFFPGFVRGTGGLLREADLIERRERFDDARRQAFWRAAGHEPPPRHATVVSIFAYDDAPLAGLLRCWEGGDDDIVAVIPEGAFPAHAARFLGLDAIIPGEALRRGRLEVRAVPFVAQARYDELLWTCDVNFVRGEDSFVRAQWAARPFVWQIYPQQERAHWRKLEAFLALYGQGLGENAREAVSALMRSWNQIDGPGVTPASAWQAYARQLDVLRRHGDAWSESLAVLGELAGNLVQFCRQKLKSG